MPVNFAEAYAGDEVFRPAVKPARRSQGSVAVAPVAPAVADASSGRSLQVFTFVLWMGFLTVGGLGFALPYVRPAAAPAEPPPVEAQFLQVELSNDELPDLSPASAPAALAIPTAPADLVQPPTIPALQVAEPSPAIAFALPVAAPATAVSAAEASYSQSGDLAPAAVLPPAKPLTFGRGEGKQPAPEYPLLARRQGQQGAVKVRLTVGPDGRVMAAEAAEASPWPMLNESALRTIRSRWRFSPGTVRLFEVVIRFQLDR